MAVPASAMRSARAWLLDVAGGVRLAAGAPFVVEYLLEPQTILIPRTPAHCRRIMLWRGRIIPLIDLAPVISDAMGDTSDWSRAVVLAWQNAPGQPLQYGGLSVLKAPVEAFVSDSDAKPLPGKPEILRELAASCFGHGDEVIAILDVRRLFTTPLLSAMDASLEAELLGPESLATEPEHAGPIAPGYFGEAMAFSSGTGQEMSSVISGSHDSDMTEMVSADDSTLPESHHGDVTIPAEQDVSFAISESDASGTEDVVSVGESLLPEDHVSDVTIPAEQDVSLVITESDASGTEDVASVGESLLPEDYVSDVTIPAEQVTQSIDSESETSGTIDLMTVAEPALTEDHINDRTVSDVAEDRILSTETSIDLELDAADMQGDYCLLDPVETSRYDSVAPAQAPTVDSETAESHVVIDQPAPAAPAKEHAEQEPLTMREALARHIARASGEDLAERRRKARHLKLVRNVITLLLLVVGGAALMWLFQSSPTAGKAETPRTVMPVASKDAAQNAAAELATKDVGNTSVPTAPARPPK